MKSVSLFLLVLLLTSLNIIAQTATEFFERGNIKDGEKDYEAAIQDYTKVIKLDSRFIAAYINRGNVLTKLHKYREAIKDYDKAIKLDANISLAYINRGTLFSKLERHQEAIKDFNIAIELDRNYVTIYIKRGFSFIILGRYHEAILDYTKAIEFSPNNYDAYNSRGNSLGFLGRYQEAILDYNKAIELSPNSAFIYRNRGNTLSNLGQYERAIQDYNTALRTEPYSMSTYINRGLAYEKLKKWQQAAADFRKALQTQPDNPKAKIALIRIEGYLQQKRTPKTWIVAVGIDTYKYPKILTSLRWSVNNANHFVNNFIRASLSSEEQTQILFNAQADKDTILQTIKATLCDPQKVYPEDMVIFYFVGHGAVLGDSFGVCPYDYYNGSKLISETDIISTLNKSPARHRFCLIESCKSENVSLSSAVSAESLQRYNNARKNYPTTTVLFTSTKVGHDSIEDVKIGGFFSHYLILGLKGQADGYGIGSKDDLISTRELFNYVKDNVMRDTSNIQEPQINDMAYQSDVPFIPVIEN